MALLFSIPSMEGCTPITFTQRIAQENCWVQFQLPENQRLCISKTIWQTWLNNPEPTAFSFLEQTQWVAHSSNHNSLQQSDQKIHSLIGYLKTTSNPSKMCPNILPLQSLEHMREKVSQFLAPYDRSGIARKLILRERLVSEYENFQYLRHLGFVHVLSTSGIHLIVIAKWMNCLLQYFFYFIKAPLKLALTLQCLITFYFTLILWILNGAMTSMLRPWSILLLRELAHFLGFRWFKGSPLLLALILDFGIQTLLLRLSPSETFFLNQGRMIYTLAVGGGLLFYDQLHSKHLGLALGSWITVAVWEIAHTGLVALATPFISLLCLPFLCMVIYPMILFSLALHFLTHISLAKDLCSLTLQISDSFLNHLLKISQLPGNLWLIHPQVFFVACFLATLGVSFGQRKFKIFLVLLAIVFRLSFSNSPLKSSWNAPYQAISIHQLDVGQGDAALIFDNHCQVGLIDTGSQHSLSAEQWFKILAERKITQIDWIALTHLDEDHAGGLKSLVHLLRIGCIVTPDQELTSPRGQVLQAWLQQQGLQLQSWSQQCIPFPHWSVYSLKGKTSRSNNENMGILWIPLTSGGFYLNAGDAHRRYETQILSFLPQSLRDHKSPRILKVSHHGSRYSTSHPFLKNLKPSESWISVGTRNHYGHPTPEVLLRLNDHAIPMIRTDQQGFLKTGDLKLFHKKCFFKFNE